MNKISHCTIAPMVAVAALAVAPLVATASDSGLSAQKFVNKAAATNMLEVKLGKLAENKSDNSKVDSFARRMISDHSAYQKKLVSAAQSQGLNVPNNLPTKLQKKYQQLSKLSGHQFDQAYARFNVAGHKKAVALLKQEKASDNNKAISRVAAQGLPTIEHHLSMAKQMNQAVNQNQ